MGRTIDESLLSTASTLIDSCSGSSDTLLFLDDEADHKPIVLWKQDGNRKKTTVAAGNITSTRVIPTYLSPGVATTNRFSIELSIGTTPVASNSKLDRLRERTRMLRKQGTQRIEESRASLRKSRSTISIPSHTSKQQESLASSRKRVHSSRRTNLTVDTRGQSDLPAFLLRSNKVIDRLSTEIATAGNIINNSGSDDNTNVNQTNVSIPPPIVSFDDDQDDTIHNDGNSFHNISVGDDWDQSTISAIPPGSLASYLPATVTPQDELPPPVPSVNCSGLPPPEVVVKPRKRRLPRKDPIIRSSQLFTEERHLLERPPSMSPQRGDCASMYNNNQKCEKLTMENDYLKRQLEILESRHRDWERNIVHQIQTELFPDAVRSPGTTAASSPTSKASFRYHSRRKRKSDHRRRFAVLLIVAPVLLTTTLWFYQAVRHASETRMKGRLSTRDGLGSSSPPSSRPSFESSSTTPVDRKAASRTASLAGVATLLREGLLRQTFFHPIFVDDQWSKIERDDTEFTEDESCSSASDDFGEETIDATPEDFPHDIIDLPSIHGVPKYRTSYEDDDYIPTSGRSGKGNRFKRWLQRKLSKMKIKIREESTPAGVWLKKQRQIQTKKLHAEL